MSPSIGNLARTGLQDFPTPVQESLPSVVPSSLPNCAAGVKPEPLFTPNTVLGINGLRVLVDFIVNAQGGIESPLILESSGEENEKLVIGMVQRWRFRPAICNGVPTSVELRVLFLGPRKRLPHPAASNRHRGFPKELSPVNSREDIAQPMVPSLSQL
ncbi:MAG: TonB family protein [Terriglobales bacterium]